MAEPKFRPTDKRRAINIVRHARDTMRIIADSYKIKHEPVPDTLDSAIITLSDLVEFIDLGD